ncbi:DNA primase [Microbacterium sp. Root166]|nr:DNA primase [Microbacterium sp. Root166]
MAESEAAEPEVELEPFVDPDPALLESHDLALAALREITPAATVGDAAEYRIERGGVVSLRFHNKLPGYPGWYWTVSLARVGGSEPTVLEVELLPGDGALLAPDWVPWAVRLSDYQAAQVALAATRDASEGDEDDEDDEDLDDVDDLDASDFDNDGSPILHAGDVDGVDIDELDEDADDSDDEDDDSDEDDSDEDDSDEDDSDEDDSDDEDDDAEQ